MTHVRHTRLHSCFRQLRNYKVTSQKLWLDGSEHNDLWFKNYWYLSETKNYQRLRNNQKLYIWLHNSKFRNQRLTVQQHSATMFSKLNILISEAMIAPFRRVLVSISIQFKYPPFPNAPRHAIVWPSPSKSSCHGSESFKKHFPPAKQGAKDCYVNLP